MGRLAFPLFVYINMPEISSFLLAVPLFLLGLYFFTKSKSTWLGNIFFGLIFLVIVILSLSYYIADRFTGEGITEAVVYHLKYGLAGAGFFEYRYLIVGGALFLVACFIILGFIIRASRKNEPRFSYSLLSLLLFTLSIISNPSSLSWYQITQEEYLAGIMPAAVAFTNKPETNFITTATTTEIIPLDPFSFEALYHNSSLVPISETHPNLVFIYLEGFEQTYSDGKTFPGLTPELNKLKNEAIVFNDITQVYSTDFTRGGMVASQCGIPLMTPSGGNSMSGMDKFFVGARCLGDLLHEQGYYLSYYGGARAEFAGKDLFYKSHGFDEFLGYEDLRPRLADKNYVSGWGIYDDSFLPMAYDRFEQLSAGTNNFGLFLITLDTHHPKGHVNRACAGRVYTDGKNPMLNAVNCSDYLVGEFVKKLRASPYGANTVIVLASDHLGLENMATKLLEKQKRTNRLMILPPSALPQEIGVPGSTLDTGSAGLPFLGFSGGIGLGRDLLSEATLTANDTKFIRDNVRKWRAEVTGLWKFPKIEQFALSSVSNKSVNIDGRTFKLPVLVEVGRDLETQLRFKFDTMGSLFFSYLDNVSSSEHFLYFDTCKEIRKIYDQVADNDYCVLFGKKNDWRATVLRGENYFTVEDIERILKI